MGLNRFRERIQARINTLDNLIKRKEKVLKNTPIGAFYICRRRQYVQYYLIDEQGTKSYISKDKMDLIKSLAQRDYDRDVLELAINEKALLEHLLSKYPKVTMEEYYESLVDSRRELINPIWLTDQEFIERWGRTPFESKKSDASEFGIVTNKGERVRSKSEKMIADRLTQLGIPYRYEAKLVLKDGTVIHPDFTLLDMRRRCEVYLEHWGRMDDADYAENAVKRMRLYERNGIIGNDRLLMTFETYKVPLDVSILDRLTAGLIVPRGD